MFNTGFGQPQVTEEVVEGEAELDSSGRITFVLVDCTDEDGNAAKHRVSLQYGESNKVSRVIVHDHEQPEGISLEEAGAIFSSLGGPIPACIRLAVWKWESVQQEK